MTDAEQTTKMNTALRTYQFWQRRWLLLGAIMAVFTRLIIEGVRLFSKGETPITSGWWIETTVHLILVTLVLGWMMRWAATNAIKKIENEINKSASNHSL